MIISDDGFLGNRTLLLLVDIIPADHSRHRAMGIAITPYNSQPSRWYILFDEIEPTTEVRKYPLYPDNWRLSC